MKQRSSKFGLLLVWMVSIIIVPSLVYAQANFITEYRLERELLNIPFTYKDHLILVKGAADDHRELTFLFDTGASAPVLDIALGLRGPHVNDTIIGEAQGFTAAETVWISSFRDVSGGRRNEPLIRSDQQDGFLMPEHPPFQWHSDQHRSH